MVCIFPVECTTQFFAIVKKKETFLFLFGFFVDSLMHRASVAEMLYTLQPDKKSEAVKMIEESTNRWFHRNTSHPITIIFAYRPILHIEAHYVLLCRNGALGQVGEWKLKDFIVIHKLLQTVLVDQDAALSMFLKSMFLFMLHLYEIVMFSNKDI